MKPTFSRLGCDVIRSSNVWQGQLEIELGPSFELLKFLPRFEKPYLGFYCSGHGVLSCHASDSRQRGHYFKVARLISFSCAKNVLNYFHALCSRNLSEAANSAQAAAHKNLQKPVNFPLHATNANTAQYCRK